MNIAKLTKTFENILKVKSNSENTIKSYSSCINSFLTKFNHLSSPKRINESMISEFIGEFNSASTASQYHSAIKLFYKYVVKQPFKLKYIPYPDKVDKLPIVLSKEKCIELIKSPVNLKHKAILHMLYDCGLRRAEILNVKIKDIDSENLLVRVSCGKGAKDRNTIVSKETISILRRYYLKYRPKEYLFEGQFGGKYSGTSILKIVNKAAKSCNIVKNVTPHVLRHSFATHLLDRGVDKSLIQELLGHSNIKTTDIYARVSTRHLSNVRSPLCA